MLKPAFNISDLFNLSGSEIFNPDEYKPTSWVSIDSRSVRKGGIFVAIHGNKFDGHKFVNDAITNGAGSVVISARKLNEFDNVNVPIITVPNPVIAFGELANCWRHKLEAKVISITGSNGKTTTKEILAALLSQKYKVVKTEANNNNHIGVPLTILSARPGTEVLVLEHGTNHFGEIEYTAKIAEPDYAMITNIGESHLEFLVDKAGVLKEKMFLLDECVNNKGRLLINIDDTLLRNLYKNYTNRITYGYKWKPNVNGSITGYDEIGTPKIKIATSKYNFECTLPLLGESNAQNFLAAFTVAIQLGVVKKDLQSAVNLLKATPGRMNLVQRGNSIIIDDTYNSNPASVAAAIKLIKKIKKYKKTLAVLGDMFELGKDAIEIHKSLAIHFKNMSNTKVFTIGKLMRGLNTELKKDKIEAQHFNTRQSLLNRLKKEDLSEYKILIKGSRGMKMEEFVEILKSKVA